jgi:hypothetical protein
VVVIEHAHTRDARRETAVIPVTYGAHAAPTDVVLTPRRTRRTSSSSTSWGDGGGDRTRRSPGGDFATPPRARGGAWYWRLRLRVFKRSLRGTLHLSTAPTRSSISAAARRC